jgi:hypothetical protein
MKLVCEPDIRRRTMLLSSLIVLGAGQITGALAGAILMGTVWAFTCKATRSFRWPIVGHVLANLFSLSVPVFLNLYVPPEMP